MYNEIFRSNFDVMIKGNPKFYGTSRTHEKRGLHKLLHFQLQALKRHKITNLKGAE